MTDPAPLLAWRDRHRGEAMIVCGCGSSLSLLDRKPPCAVIGVNDVGRQFDPDYLLVVNPRAQFPADRFAAIEQSRARAVFTSVADLGLAHPQVIRVGLGRRGGTAVDAQGRLPFTRNSPYIALALAVFMGARRIGLIGVDFTQHHFFGATGTHPLARELAQIDREYGKLAAAAAAEGTEIVNLSPQSRLTTLRREAVGDFLSALPEKRRVLHITRTNCAGAIWKLHRLMAADGRVESRVASASPVTSGINGPRRYPQDIPWTDSAAMRAAIDRADILHFHNFVDAAHAGLRPFASAMRGKPAVLQVHSEPAVLAPHFPGRDPRTRTDLPVLVIAQKHARFYPNATPVLNALDPADFANCAGADRPAAGLPRVVYTPTDLADYPPHPPTCRGKGYARTRAILMRLAQAGLIEHIIATDLDYSAAMALSHGAAAKIDECVTGGYHLTSLEALAQGLATFAWLDGETRALLARMTGSPEAALPWVSVPLDGLEDRLAAMARDPDAFAEAGRAGRAWITRYWTKDAVLNPIFATYDQLLQGTAPHRDTAPPPPSPSAAVTGRLRGRPSPRRSEDHAQRIHLPAALLARAGSLKNGTAHVLGNGPSLADADIVELAGDCVIGVNAAVLLQERLGRPLDYYCVSDRRFLLDPEGAAMARTALPAIRVFAGYCDGLVAGDDIAYVHILPGDGASDDITHGAYHGCSVVLFAAQIAAWLGARDIVLHGMDCDYGAGRFYGKPGGKRPFDAGIYPRVARCAGALAALMKRRGGQLSVAGPSRLTGGYKSTAIPGIATRPTAGTNRPRHVAE